MTEGQTVEKRAVLYDSGRLPIWLRVLCLVLAVLFLLLAVDVLMSTTVGLGLLGREATRVPLGPVPTIILLLLMAYVFYNDILRWFAGDPTGLGSLSGK